MIDRIIGPQPGELQDKFNSAVQGTNRASTDVSGTDRTKERSFGEALMEAMSGVNDLERAADAATEDLATGNSDDIVGAVMAAEKAQLAMGATLKVRQQALESYDQIMRMQI